MRNRLMLLFMLLLYAGTVYAELPLDKKPTLLELKESCGGRLDGTPWSSAEITGRVYAVYYIDPDEADLNEELFTALKAQQYPREKVQSVALINMKATWLPKTLLNMLLKRKQKRYPQTTYVNDYCRKGVTEWHLADHSSDVLFFDQQGRVIFSRDGRLTEAEVSKAVDLIWHTIGGKEPVANE